MKSAILQNDADRLLSSFIDEEDPAIIVLTIVHGYIACTLGSVERHFLGTVIASCRVDSKVHMML